MATTNMNLTLPTVGVTTGPTWASQLNTAFETVDSHDHTTGKGVAVPVSGMNFNAAVNFGNNALSGITTISAASLTLSGGITVGSNIVSDTNNTDTLGTSGVRWANVFSVLGNFSGTITSASIVPTTTNNYDLGSSSSQYSNLYVATILSNNTEVLVTDHLRPSANNTYELGGAVTKQWSNINSVLGTFTGTITSSALLPSTGNTYDIGASGTRYDKIFASALDLSKTSATIINTASDGTSSNSILSHYSSTASAGANLILRRSKNATLGSHTAVALNDELGRIAFQGSDGVEFLNAAAIACTVPAAVTGGGTDDMPGQLIFYTTPDGSGTLTPAMYILSTQSTAFAGSIRGTGNGTIDCGESGFLWNNVFAEKGTFNEDNATQTNAGERSKRNNIHAWINALTHASDPTQNPTYVAAQSYNISAVARAGTGVYDLTLSSAVTNLAYTSVTHSTSDPTARIMQAYLTSTTNVRLLVFDAAGTAADLSNSVRLMVSVIGY